MSVLEPFIAVDGSVLYFPVPVRTPQAAALTDFELRREFERQCRDDTGRLFVAFAKKCARLRRQLGARRYKLRFGADGPRL